MYYILLFKTLIFDYAIVNLTTKSRLNFKSNPNKNESKLYTATFCLILLNILLVYSRIINKPNNGGRTSITISENAGNYMLSADFNVNETRKIQEYINKCLKPNSLFGSEDDNFDLVTTLTDKTELHIKELPGKLEINLDKSKNSAVSYYRVKRMCEGVKDILGHK